MDLTQAAVALYETLSAGKVAEFGDRERLGLAGLSIEAILDCVARSYPALLHGGGAVIPAGNLLRLSPGRARFGRPPRPAEGFATDSGGIALLKALFSNVVNLGYPYVITRDAPLMLTIQGWRPEAERSRGYVHLIGPKTHFEREFNWQGIATWQWVTCERDATFEGAIEVRPTDFVHPVVRR